MKTGPRTVAIYARVSSDDQVQNTSLDDQVARATAEAERRGWKVFDTFRDEGVTGTTADRPA